MQSVYLGKFPEIKTIKAKNMTTHILSKIVTQVVNFQGIQLLKNENHLQYLKTKTTKLN